MCCRIDSSSVSLSGLLSHPSYYMLSPEVRSNFATGERLRRFLWTFTIWTFLCKHPKVINFIREPLVQRSYSFAREPPHQTVCVCVPKRLQWTQSKRKTVWKRSKCKHLPLFAILNVPQKASSRTDLSLIHFNMAAIWSGNPTSCAAGSFNTIVDDHLSTLIPSLMNPNFELTAIGNEPLSFHHCQSLQCKSTVYLICLVMD